MSDPIFSSRRPVRRLSIVLGDQLDHASALFDGFDPARDLILMTEAREEATYLRQHKKRLALFFAAMRAFAADQRAAGRAVLYRRLDGEEPAESLGESLARAIAAVAPERVLVVKPGDLRVERALAAAARAAGRDLEILEDRHFLSSPEAFARWSAGRKRVILEDFYRAERKRAGVLMTDDGEPVGGAWNFDKDNRKSFGRNGPGFVPPRLSFAPSDETRDVVAMVARLFPDAPGALEPFEEPVTRADARRALDDFVRHRLVAFGDYQDAIAVGRRDLYHSRLSSVMNLKLLHPEEAISAALAAYHDGAAPLNAVEGFIRQIMGWREFVRGVYWTRMPDYAQLNTLDADLPVPAFFWTGETDMACLSDALQGLVQTAYAHHIQRLMVMGLYMMLYGAHPYRAHEWHMEMYLDAIDWVSLPNVLGMSQHGDGGVVGTKPYAASGAYIDRMSDACRGCSYNPAQAVGDTACPFTTLYWDFLARHQARFSKNLRMAMQLKNLERKSEDDLRAIRRAADAHRRSV